MKEMRLSFEILMISLLLACSVMKGQEKLSDGIEKKIDSIFSYYEGKPGCAIAVIKNDETLFQKGYGLANLGYDIPITTKTVFDANAMTKQVTAACIFMLEEEGKLKLDDSIQKFLPEFPQYKEGGITIRNLLYQTSGLRSYLAILFSQNRYFGDSVDNGDVLKMIMKQLNLNFEPGSRQELSNSNYVLLAHIVKKTSDKSLTDYAKEKLFDPLNMTNTFFLDNPNELIKNRALAYQEEENQFALNHFFNASVVGDGGLQTNLEDMVKWAKNLSSSDVLAKNLTDKIVASGTLNSGAEANYAGGLFVQNHYDIEGLPTVRHSGEWAGFRSLYYRFLNQDVTFIILSNNANTNVWGLLDQLTPFFLADEIAQAQQLVSQDVASIPLKEVKLKNKELQLFLGNFYNTINGNIRSIELVDGKLFYKRTPNAPGSPLSAISPTELLFEALPFIKLSYGEKHKTMIFTINDLSPIPFERYQSFVYDQKDLKEFENDYYNEDLEVTYQIKSAENQLRILIEGKELVVLSPFTKDKFREEHFGYITFERDNTGKIKGFSRTDNTFTNLVFYVWKSGAS